MAEPAARAAWRAAAHQPVASGRPAACRIRIRRLAGTASPRRARRRPRACAHAMRERPPGPMPASQRHSSAWRSAPAAEPRPRSLREPALIHRTEGKTPRFSVARGQNLARFLLDGAGGSSSTILRRRKPSAQGEEQCGKWVPLTRHSERGFQIGSGSRCSRSRAVHDSQGPQRPSPSFLKRGVQKNARFQSTTASRFPHRRNVYSPTHVLRGRERADPQGGSEVY